MRAERLTRRSFVIDLGLGALGVLITAACSESQPSSVTSTEPAPPESAKTVTTPSTSGATSSIPVATTSAPGDGVAWERVDLGFVSAYVLVRRTSAAIVDTGVSGSAETIGESLTAIGLGWGDVSDVILTHLHPDHIGSLGDVMAAAGDANAHAGAGDLAAMSASPRPVAAVSDGDQVFGLEIIETPGHTPGHICVLDRAGGILVVGDALNGDEGRVVGPNPQFTPDMTTANESVAKLATFDFDVALFGHGDPVVGGASGQVAELAASL